MRAWVIFFYFYIEDEHCVFFLILTVPFIFLANFIWLSWSFVAFLDSFAIGCVVLFGLSLCHLFVACEIWRMPAFRRNYFLFGFAIWVSNLSSSSSFFHIILHFNENKNSFFHFQTHFQKCENRNIHIFGIFVTNMTHKPNQIKSNQTEQMELVILILNFRYFCRFPNVNTFSSIAIFFFIFFLSLFLHLNCNVNSQVSINYANIE